MRTLWKTRSSSRETFATRTFYNEADRQLRRLTTGHATTESRACRRGATPTPRPLLQPGLRKAYRRLAFVRAQLGEGVRVDLDAGQANYLGNVMRLGEGAELLVFDGSSGEWLSRISEAGKKRMALTVERRTREPEAIPELSAGLSEPSSKHKPTGSSKRRPSSASRVHSRHHRTGPSRTGEAGAG